jgi:hypothetical protein
MQPGDTFQLDLGSAQTFNQIVLDTTGSPGDFPRQYQVYVSADGADWGQPIAVGPGNTVTRILFPQVTGRYVKIVNQGSAGSWWSIHELNVLAPNGPATPPPPSDSGVQRKTAALPDGTQLLVAFNSGNSVATFDVPWGDTVNSYRLPAGAAAIFTTRSG